MSRIPSTSELHLSSLDSIFLLKWSIMLGHSFLSTTDRILSVRKLSDPPDALRASHLQTGVEFTSHYTEGDLYDLITCGVPSDDEICNSPKI